MDRHNVMFSQNCPFPWLWGYEPPSNSLQSTSNRHLDRFSRVCTRVPNTNIQTTGDDFSFFLPRAKDELPLLFSLGLYLSGDWGVEPPAKISDPLLLLKKRKGGRLSMYLCISTVVDFDPS